MSLSGKVAWITGASRGIGKEIAEVLASQGMLVAINGRSQAVEQVAAGINQQGYRCLAMLGDVSRKAHVQRMMKQVEDQLGPLWLLVNNAGLLKTGPTAEMSEEDWDAAFAIDAKGVFLCSQAAIQRMIPRKQGRIVNISSIAGQIVRIKQIAYCSAKAAVIHFSRCLAIEMAPYGITVNCLCPGMTRTDMLVDSAVERGLDLQAMTELIPAGRMASGADHAHLVAYFASQEAAHVTGQVVSVDGGQSQYMPLARR
jgi:NAD(P)-dependent dehydrogenase (short-subunit alcohol dehydrogenase family)